MKTTTIIIIVVALALAGGAYYYFFVGSGNEPPLTAVAEPSSAQMRFESLSTQLPSSFNVGLFSDTRFKALVDITQPITQEPLGRIDPLAPLGSGSPGTGTSTGKAPIK